jgi:hypothetical protein
VEELRMGMRLFLDACAEPEVERILAALTMAAPASGRRASDPAS